LRAGDDDLTLTADQIRDDYSTLLAEGYVSRKLDLDEHEHWRKEIRRRCRQDKLRVSTGPAYNAERPPVAVKAFLDDRWLGTTVYASDGQGNLKNRKVESGEDPLKAALELRREVDADDAASD
jgi:hypothetical protein